jgi:hypothetical protein
MSDLMLGLVALIIAAVPVSLGVLMLADGFGLDGEGRTRRWIRIALAVLAVPALAWTGVAAWGWAGAAHLAPLCQAYATPEFRAVRQVPPGDILLDVGQVDGATVGSRASPPDLPPWSKALGARLVTDASSPAAAAAPLELEVRRLTHHQSLWFKVEMDRFRLIERQWDSVLAEGDELWISAGRARYHCGLVSGARPVRADRTPWPGGAGIAKFVEQGRQPAPVAGTPTIPATLGP